MNRCKDHLCFAVRFVGLGYVVLWPLTASGYDGKLFGASILCGDDGALTLGMLGPLCHSAHPLTLSPALHIMGFVAALVVGARLLRRLLRRFRRARAAPIPTTAIDSSRVALRPARPSAPLRLPRPVSPRSQFGLRGTKRATQAPDMA